MSSKIEYIKSCIDECKLVEPKITAYITFNSADDVCCFETPSNVDLASNVIVMVDCRWLNRGYRNDDVKFFYFKTRDDGTTYRVDSIILPNDWELRLLSGSNGYFQMYFDGVVITRNDEKYKEICNENNKVGIKQAIRKLVNIASMSEEEHIEYKSIQELKQQLDSKDSYIKRLELLCENKEKQIEELKEKVENLTKFENTIDKIQELIAELDSDHGDEE